MNKPLSMTILEMKSSIIDIINKSGISPTIVEMVMRDLYTDIKNQCIAFEKTEQEAYKKSLENSKEKKKEEEKKEASE